MARDLRLLTMSAANVKLLGEYRLFLKARNVRPESQFKILELATRFASFCEPRPLLKATTEDVEAWLAQCNIGACSRYCYISNLHGVYRWALIYGHGTHDPTARVVRPRMPRGIPHPIDDDDLKHALAGAPKVERAIIALAAFHGLRAGEIARLQRQDIVDSNSPPVLVVQEGKGGHSRVLPLHAEAWEMIRPVTHVRGHFFTRPNGEPYNPHRVAYMVRRTLHDMGSTPRATRYGTGSAQRSTARRATSASRRLSWGTPHRHHGRLRCVLGSRCPRGGRPNRVAVDTLNTVADTVAIGVALCGCW